MLIRVAAGSHSLSCFLSFLSLGGIKVTLLDEHTNPSRVDGTYKSEIHRIMGVPERATPSSELLGAVSLSGASRWEPINYFGSTISSPLANVRQTRVLIEFLQKVLLCYNFVPRIFPGSEELAPATGTTRHHGNETSPSYNGEPRSGEMSRSVVFVHWMTSK
jgi:hypothetical protein